MDGGVRKVASAIIDCVVLHRRYSKEGGGHPFIVQLAAGRAQITIEIKRQACRRFRLNASRPTGWRARHMCSAARRRLSPARRQAP